MNHFPFNYIAVDGPIGVGKTTIVNLLTDRFEGVKVLEDAKNPFLDEFYQDRPGSSFQTQLYFLLSRFRQQQELVQPGLFDRLVVADYPFHKDRIFAYLNLGDDELALYEKLFTLLEPQAPKPDLVLYLVADLETCMHRVSKRGRDYERRLSKEYMTQLIDAYNYYYHYYDRTPLLVVDTRDVNFPDRPEDFEDLVEQLHQPIKGTQHYVPRKKR